LRKQQYNDFYQQNPRGIFTFTGTVTQGISNGVATGGSDLADFLMGVPDTRSRRVRAGQPNTTDHSTGETVIISR
jgi:hypothetical protein